MIKCCITFLLCSKIPHFNRTRYKRFRLFFMYNFNSWKITACRFQCYSSCLTSVCKCHKSAFIIRITTLCLCWFLCDIKCPCRWRNSKLIISTAKETATNLNHTISCHFKCKLCCTCNTMIIMITCSLVYGYQTHCSTF